MELTFISAFENINEFRAKGSFSTWITRILINQSILFKRRGDKIAGNLRNNAAVSPLMHYFKLQNNSGEKEMMKNFERDVQLIPGKFKDLYLLRAKEGMSVKEISTALGLSRIDVLVRLFRLKYILKVNKKIITLNFLLICMGSEYTNTILNFYRKILLGLFTYILQLLNFA